MLVAAFWSVRGSASESGAPSEILIDDMPVFDGCSDDWSGSLEVLVRKLRIAAIGTDLTATATGRKIDGPGRALLPRLFDVHVRLRFSALTMAEWLALSGPRNPSPGRLGVIEEGAPAALLLLEGNPLERLELLADPECRLLLIMQDGRIVKDRSDAD